MRILKKIAVILLGGALSIVSLAAQNRTVSGTVLDSSQQPIIGAAVMLQGTTIGNTTDVDGRFSLDVPEGDASILVTCLGYVDQNINVPANTSDITVILQEDNLMLEETVVVGYGVQKKVNLTGSISVVGSEELENRINHSVTNMLQGAAAGVNVTTSSGKPGSSGSINIRGTNSINSAEPHFYCQGCIRCRNLRSACRFRCDPRYHQVRNRQGRKGYHTLQRTFRLGGTYYFHRL